MIKASHCPTTNLKYLNLSFKDNSYGFRSNKNSHQAIEKARQYINEGYIWVVDIDLEKYFDIVNHDKLMALVAREVKDKRVLKLIRAYLKFRCND
jgi:retron-type reverse transcriptase